MKTALSKLSGGWLATEQGTKPSNKVEYEKAMEKNLTTLDTIVLVASITSLLALSLAGQIVGVNLLRNHEESENDKL